MGCLRAALSGLGLFALACSSSSKTVATDSCSPGEISPCVLASGCEAHKTCNPDGKSYGPCECSSSTGGSSGAGGRGGTGPSGGAGGLPGGSAGMPPGGAGGTPPGGSAGGPVGGSAGSPVGGSGGLGPLDGSAGVAGAPVGGSSGAPPLDSGPGGGPALDGPCASCMQAVEQGAGPYDPLICASA